MRNISRDNFEQDYEYESFKKEVKKLTKRSREERKLKRQWQPLD